ncbi:UDP-N-acetylmuramoyl-L-alanyl-D-glutamate--2,6-diaminopimelate ligase [uncultured Xylophilus sp.]|uniref:UDP-N-acetylmuramoyl-L-alanyl-D-glutamate--2, 6-diaminopimelate ligase n=1 Tax=uncultured Xylophilus sp. TaxID=296832 RepID=UPI0025F324A4|nr:UDP-N-acetylmuramoyl-L-alanyl-D-glutamate--2,6-diaminopimelate ligase [uncultured Xylophilus sp.]
MAAPALPPLDGAGDAVAWLRARVTGTLQTDSRRVGPGDGFIAWPGAATDGRAHVRAAFAQGAAACLVEHDGADAFDVGTGDVAALAGLKAATGPIAADWFGRPSDRLDLLAVTGTNGKTTTTWWLAQALSKVEHAAQTRCALVGTLGTGIPPQVDYNGLTTPDPVLLQRVLRGFVDAGAGACAIEASSIGIAERRLDGCRIRVGIFTNFTQDHLDYHGTMEAYWQAKAGLFDWQGLQAAVVNADDAAGADLARTLAARPLDLWTFSCGGAGADTARLRAEAIGYGSDGLRCVVVEGEDHQPLATRAIGHYNLYNLLGVVGTLRALGVPLAAAVAACHGLGAVPGRMECVVRDGAPLVAVDYAHTPDAIAQALAALRPLADERGGALVCVFGCGGDRDGSKRPRMAAAAAAGADKVWLTSDNPRREDPLAILAQAAAGLPPGHPTQQEPDRARAIAAAIAAAGPHDVVLLAGKGHEDYQEIAGVRRPFSDRAEAERALAAYRSGTAARHDAAQETAR